MNFRNRLRKLERNAVPQPPSDETEMCDHPPSMFHLYRSQPASGYADHRLVVKGHCNACGFDDYLWFDCRLTEEQEYRRQELIRSSAFWELNAYDLQLVNAGLINYVVFPPPPEVQIKFTGKVSI